MNKEITCKIINETITNCQYKYNETAIDIIMIIFLFFAVIYIFG